MPGAMDDIITVRCDRDSDASATIARIEAFGTTYVANAYPRADVGSADAARGTSKFAHDSADQSIARELWLLIDNGRMLKLADTNLTIRLDLTGTLASNR